MRKGCSDILLGSLRNDVVPEVALFVLRWYVRIGCMVTVLEQFSNFPRVRRRSDAQSHRGIVYRHWYATAYMM